MTGDNSVYCGTSGRHSGTLAGRCWRCVRRWIQQLFADVLLMRVQLAHMASAAAGSSSDLRRLTSWRVMQASVLCIVLLSLLVLYACTYVTLKNQLQRLSADVDQLKAAHARAADAAAGLHGDDELLRARSKRHDVALNESAASNMTASDNDDESAGSGELDDSHQYRGIWMGTYSRVSVRPIGYI